jgi:hypothetical protein
MGAELQALLARHLTMPHALHAADDALARDSEERSTLRKDARARVELGHELAHRMPQLHEDLDGAEDLDEAFAAHLAHLGKAGQGAAGFLRGMAQERAPGVLWREREGMPPPFAVLLAMAIWGDVVEPRMRTKPASLVVPIMRAVTELQSRATPRQEDGAIRLSPGRGFGVSVPVMKAGIVHAFAARGVNLLGSIAAHRLVRWEVFEGHMQVMRGVPDARKIVVKGGWSGLAETLGMTGRRDAETLRDIVHAQASCFFELPTKRTHGNLVILEETIPAAPGRPAKVAIVLGTMILPGFVFEIKENLGRASLSAREAMRLVPMVDLPPLVGRPNEHGAQATLSMAVVSEMRERATELVRRGGVKIELDRFRALAQLAGLPVHLVGMVRDRWVQDGDDAPAFLRVTGPDRYVLGDAHAAARGYLHQSGLDTLNAQRDGLRAAAARRAQQKTLQMPANPAREATLPRLPGNAPSSTPERSLI